MAHDTLLESYVYEVHQRHDLDAQWRSAAWLADDLLRRRHGQGRISRIEFFGVDIERATQYAAEDSRLRACSSQRALSEDRRRREAEARIRDDRAPVLSVLFKIERNRKSLLDTEASSPRRPTSSVREMLEIDRRPIRSPGSRFNLNSPRQIQKFCSSGRQLPVRKKTPSGQPSTDEDVLAELALNYPLPKLLLEYRALAKLKSTYTDKLPRMVKRADRARAHHVLPDDGSDRPACFERPEPRRTFRSARHRGVESAQRSSQHRDGRFFRPTTRRSSCGSWRTFPEMKACARVRARARRASRHRAEVFGLPLDR
jgi:DNA polymerase-1